MIEEVLNFLIKEKLGGIVLDIICCFAFLSLAVVPVCQDDMLAIEIASSLLALRKVVTGLLLLNPPKFAGFVYSRELLGLALSGSFGRDL